jgi:diguanylate cyclase (GGDEF)-like protein
LIDFQLRPGTAFDFLAATKEASFATVVLTGHADEALAMETLHHGAQDYLKKEELSPQLLLRTLRYACERKTAIRQMECLNRELEIANAALLDIAHHDPLTGALNRRGLEKQLTLEAYRAERNNSNMMMLLIDCDDFKYINETNGYTMGDQVLQAVTQTLKKSVRPTDHVARIGGDEFLVLLSNIQNSTAIILAEKIANDIRAQQIQSSAGPVKISVSIGCCPVLEGETSLNALLQHGEKALKQSKTEGKDRITFLESV